MRRNLARVIVFVVGFAVGGMLASETPKYIYKVLKFDAGHVGIYCTNGADPTITNPDARILEVSCVDERTGK